mgnify:FL=1
MRVLIDDERIRALAVKEGEKLVIFYTEKSGLNMRHMILPGGVSGVCIPCSDMTEFCVKAAPKSSIELTALERS